MSRNLRAVLFDWDGTLVAASPDFVADSIACAVQHLLQ
jgi:phosphoglycolate phosphatase-like HAD superfamily hydrolase